MRTVSLNAEMGVKQRTSVRIMNHTSRMKQKNLKIMIMKKKEKNLKNNRLKNQINKKIQIKNKNKKKEQYL